MSVNPTLTIPEALAVIYSYSPALMQIHPGDREMLAEAQRVVGGSASDTRERFREAAKGIDPLAKFVPQSENESEPRDVGEDLYQAERAFITELGKEAK